MSYPVSTLLGSRILRMCGLDEICLIVTNWWSFLEISCFVDRWNLDIPSRTEKYTHIPRKYNNVLIYTPVEINYLLLLWFNMHQDLSFLPLLTQRGSPHFCLSHNNSIFLSQNACLNIGVVYLIYPAALALHKLDTCFITLAFIRKCYFVLFLCLYWNNSYFYLIFLLWSIFSTLICKHFRQNFIAISMQAIQIIMCALFFILFYFILLIMWMKSILHFNILKRTLSGTFA